MALILETIKNDQEVSIVETLTKLVEVKEQLAALKSTEKTLTALIQRAMGQNEELLDGDGEVLATWKYSERTSIDSKRLQEELPEIAEAYTTTKKVRTFRCL